MAYLQQSHQAHKIKRLTDNDLNQHCRSNTLSHTIVASYYLKHKNYAGICYCLQHRKHL
jgi:hypothetical protein